MIKQLKELVKIGRKTNKTLERSNRIIIWTIALAAVTVIVNVITIIAIVWAVTR